jgi:hypothetical protein
MFLLGLNKQYTTPDVQKMRAIQLAWIVKEIRVLVGREERVTMRQHLAFLALLYCATLRAAADDTIDVSGLVREQETSRPISNVMIVLSNGRTEVRVQSDDDGRYECRIPPGIITGQVVEAPREFVKPLRAFRAPVELAPNVKVPSLPVIELQRGMTVRGRVVDDEGSAVPGAHVQAVWYAFEPWQEGRVRGPKSLVATSDERGEFELLGIDPSPPATRVVDDVPRFWAANADVATERLQSLPVTPDAPIALRLSRTDSARLRGRLTDRGGQPVSGARIEVWTRWRKSDNVVVGEAPLSLMGHRELVSDKDGHFDAPCPIGRAMEYRVFARPEGYTIASSGWHQSIAEATPGRIELQLDRLRQLEGRVVDVEGSPLSGVRIFQSPHGVPPMHATSGGDGRFTLVGVAGERAFLFAEREGYRFAGVPIDRPAGVEIVLNRLNQPIAPLRTIVDPVLSREDELALARRVARPFVDRALEKASRTDAFWALKSWARLDPGDALERFDRGVIPAVTADERDVFRTWAVASLLYDDLDEAEAIVTSIDNDSRRAEATTLLAVRAPSSRGQARELLEQAVLCARHEEVGARCIWLACAADALLDLGEDARARSLLAEAETEAAGLPTAGSAGGGRRYVAEVLARVDLNAALDLVKDVAEDASRDDVYGRIACRVAHQQPPEAERVLGMVADAWRRQRWAERVCSRMASTDPVRAEMIAALITNPYRRALALGWMADARASSDKAQARVWLDRAFAELDRIVAAGEARLCGPQSAAVTAALLLPAAKAIDPHLARECFWRAVSFRRSADDGDEQQVLTETAALALLLARYDRPTARRLLEPIVALMERKAIDDASECSATAVNAMCVVDPQWAADFVERQWSDADRIRYWDESSSWAVFAWHLGTRPETRTRRFLRDYLDGAYWQPGGPDNPFHDRF